MGALVIGDKRRVLLGEALQMPRLPPHETLTIAAEPALIEQCSVDFDLEQQHTKACSFRQVEEATIKFSVRTYQ